MVNIIGLGLFGMLFLAMLAIISNTSSTSIGNIQAQLNRINCPTPEASGLWNNTGTIRRTGQTYNYPSVSNKTLTLTCTNVHTADGFDYCYGCPTVSFAGMMFYMGDWISEVVGNKGSGIGTLLFFFLTPANFNILGYTINDLIGVPLMVVIVAYAISYIFIGAMLYKMLSPWSGA